MGPVWISNSFYMSLMASLLSRRLKDVKIQIAILDLTVQKFAKVLTKCTAEIKVKWFFFLLCNCNYKTRTNIDGLHYQGKGKDDEKNAF